MARVSGVYKKGGNSGTFVGYISVKKALLSVYFVVAYKKDNTLASLM